MGGTYDTIKQYTGVDVTGHDKPGDIVSKFVNDMVLRFGKYIPPVLAATVFFTARFIGIIIGLLAVVIAGLIYLLLKLTKVITIRVEPRDKQIISF